ncbi:MAG: J domain-containing protein, partial [Acidobacteriota bacterium]
LSRIDGTTSASRLTRLVPLGREEVVRAAAVLVVAGLVEVHDEPAVRPQPAPEVELPLAVEAEPDEGEEEQVAFTPEQQREFEEVVKLAAEMRHRDFYRRLGLTRGATLDQVHSRYRELTRNFHPDRAREDHLRPLRRELAEISASVQEAYETLASPESRSKYDQANRGSDRVSSEHHKEEERRQRARNELVAANVRRARELARIGDVGMAVQLLDQAVRFNPDPETLLFLATLEFRNPMWVQRGLDRLRRAVTVDPRCTEAWLQLANFWMVRHKVDKQRQCLDRILEYDPTNEDAIRELQQLNSRANNKKRR